MKTIENIIVAHLNDEASTEEVQRLFEWIREQPENAKEFARCSLLHAQLHGQFAGQMRANRPGETAVRPTSTQTRESRPTWKSGALALAACLLIAVGACVWWMFAGRGAGDDLILLAPVEQAVANKPMMPFTMEADADVIAIAVIGQPQSRREQQVVRLELVEVLKGDRQLRSLESADGVIVHHLFCKSRRCCQ